MKMELSTIDNGMEIKFSNTDKMPWLSWDTPAWECKTGSKLAEIEGTVCYGCYANKNRYTFGIVKNANTARFAQLQDLQTWKNAFISQLRAKYKSLRDKNKAYFRWHTSGDIQSLEHLVAINEIAKALPDIKFWLPTKEFGMVRQFQAIYGEFAENLNVRLSMFKIDQVPSKAMGLPTSTCISSKESFTADHGKVCPASETGKCGDCRDCWNKNVDNVAYLYH